MPTVNKSIIVPYTPAQMYTLVNDIPAYPEFVPACQRAEIISQDNDEIMAKMYFASHGFEKSFSTCNRLQKDKMIEVRLLDGPFKHLEGFWRFESHGQGCEVILDMEFEFSSKLIGMMFCPVFIQVTTTLVEAFKKRAEQIYAR